MAPTSQAPQRKPGVIAGLVAGQDAFIDFRQILPRRQGV